MVAICLLIPMFLLAALLGLSSYEEHFLHPKPAAGLAVGPGLGPGPSPGMTGGEPTDGGR